MMLRRVYVFLVRLHPKWFRQRFGDEMLWIYDCTEARAERARLLADGLLSVLRQHAFRSPARTQSAPDRVPVFAAVDTSAASMSVLLQGAVATVLIWWLFSLGMRVGTGRGSRDFPAIIAGSVYDTGPMVEFLAANANAPAPCG